jgi:3-deoxy-D-manno-octulosonic-acid transferase
MSRAPPPSMSRPLSLTLYAAAAGAAGALAPLWLRRRIGDGKEDEARWRERLGLAGLARPAGRLAWMHGVSVGESLALLPLVHRLRAEAPDVAVLVTSATRASAELLAARLPASVLHQYAPLDTPGAARRFLDHWRPELGVFVESELWPNLILAARSRGVRLALVSARMSPRSLAGWRRAPGAARAVLRAFDLILARDAEAADRLAALGARIDGLADLKFAAPPLPVDAERLDRLRGRLGGRRLILAASTHPGEDALVLGAFAALGAEGAARLVVVPRHPVRGPRVELMARGMGLAVSRHGGAPRAEAEAEAEAEAGAQTGVGAGTGAGTGTGTGTGSEEAFGEAAVHVADTLGELGLWYRLASLAVIGGSLPPGDVGGHNPLEPARLGCPFIAGRGVGAWPVYEALEAAGATARIAPDALAAWFARAAEDPAALRPMADRAAAFVSAGDAAAAAATDQVMELLAR